MRYTIHYSLLLLLCLTSLNCASSRLPGWSLLGQRTVNHAVDRDEIRVGARDGTFRRIKLLVRQRSVTFRDVKVHYANGGVEDVSVRRSIPAGGETRAIDLNGRDRIIDFDAQVPDGAFDLGVAEQQLHGSQIAGAAID